MTAAVLRLTAAVLRRLRSPVGLLVGVLAVASAVVLLAAPGGSGEPLDPASPSRSGGKALAAVLRDQGVEVVAVSENAAAAAAADAGAEATVLVTEPDLLTQGQVDRLLGTDAALVLVGASEPERWQRGVEARTEVPVRAREPRCALAAAARAGRAASGGTAYQVTLGGTADADLCYAVDGDATVVAVRDGGRRTTFVGAAAAFGNARLDEEGNAALALGVLGERSRLVWYVPSLADVPADAPRESFYALVPDRVWWVVAQVVVAVLLLALWRMRRLGRVVPERLPVVVRAAEAVEGRARLYRRAGARDRALDALRAGVVHRLRGPLGLPPGAMPAAVVDAVARRSRRAPGEVAALLYGAPASLAADDAALVRAAEALHRLEEEVRRS